MVDKLLAGREQVSLKPTHKVQEQTVTLTFGLATTFVFDDKLSGWSCDFMAVTCVL